MRGDALASILDNYNELMNMWEWSLEVLKDTDMKARVRGVQAMMPNFRFFFGCLLGERLLKRTDNLSRALRVSTISAAEGYSIAQLVIKTLPKDRNDDSFDLFWELLLACKNELGSNNLELLRKKKLPVWWDSDRRQTYQVAVAQWLSASKIFRQLC